MPRQTRNPTAHGDSSYIRVLRNFVTRGIKRKNAGTEGVGPGSA